MEGFKRNSYASHGFSKIELFVIVLAIVLVVFVAVPKVKSMLLNIKLNSAIDSVYSYKESVNNYYVSQLLVDSDFKLDGIYTISNGKLITDDDIYNILMAGNVPSEGYLAYDDNYLKNGCVVIGEYAFTVSDGDVVSAMKGNCNSSYASVSDVDVAFGM